ncbi:DUF4304 domain-containing protein [Candidatus Gottesmanbacteria bacterium]|nr:DUF4304 domain-containing protein [Candidatus Gottesmanbacteria bacterium]
MTKNDLVKVIDDYLTPVGFIRKDKTWYKETPETIVMFTIDKSQYSILYYVSVHFFLKEVSSEKFPKFWKSHSYFRAEDYMEEDTKNYLDLENDLDDKIRKVKIKQLLEKSLSILKLFETKEGIKKTLSLYNPRALGINLKAQKYLGIHIP